MKSIMYVLLLALAVSCAGGGGRTTTDLREIVGNRMTLPRDARRKIVDRDTVLNYSNSPKVVVYINAEGCTSCRMKGLPNWYGFFKETDSICAKKSGNLEYVFIFNTKHDDPELRSYLTQYNFPKAVVCDEAGEFEKANLLPEDGELHVFLLDGNDNIKIVGSPIYNLKMREHYKHTIAGMFRTN